MYVDKKKSQVAFLVFCTFLFIVLFLAGISIYRTVVNTETNSQQQIEPTSYIFFTEHTRNCPFEDRVRSCFRYQNDLNFSSFSSQRSSFLQANYINKLVEVYTKAVECAEHLTCDKSLRSLFFDMDSKVNTYKLVYRICQLNKRCVTQMLYHQF